MDWSQIVTTIITALVTIFTVIINVKTTENKITSELKINQAVTDEKLRSLTSEVKRHNDFAQKIPSMEVQISSLNTRVTKLEDKS